MRLTTSLKTLRRGLRIATRALVAQIGADPAARRHAPAHVPGSVTNPVPFGRNPGRLQMRLYLPASPVRTGSPLVVLLHGCGQDAAGFAVDSGWTGMADRLGVPLVLPEQTRANNQHQCFRWFRPADTMRDSGEAGSMANMVRAALVRFKSDPKRVFVAGMSAGGAMAATLLAAYPDLFAGGAVIAGLPVGAASSALEALARMADPGPEQDPSDLALRARRLASPGFAGPWPRLSIWHGANDMTVAPGNADLLAAQWRGLNDLPEIPDPDTREGGVRHQTWMWANGPMLEQWTIPGLSHGYPISSHRERLAAHVIDCGVPATEHVARFWGLI